MVRLVARRGPAGVGVRVDRGLSVGRRVGAGDWVADGVGEATGVVVGVVVTATAVGVEVRVVGGTAGPGELPLSAMTRGEGPVVPAKPWASTPTAVVRIRMLIKVTSNGWIARR
jgi:hypothetical protein